jgi:hypothetical protein
MRLEKPRSGVTALVYSLGPVVNINSRVAEPSAKCQLYIYFSNMKANTLPILMHQMRISTTQVSSVMLRSKKLEIREKNVKTERPVGCH